MKLLSTKALGLILLVIVGIGVSIDRSWAVGGGKKTSAEDDKGGKVTRILPQLMDIIYPVKASIHIKPATALEGTLENLDTLLATQSTQPPEEWAADAMAVSLQFFQLKGYGQGVEIIQKARQHSALSGDAFWSSRFFEAWGLLKSCDQSAAFSIYEEIFRAHEEHHPDAPSDSLVKQSVSVLKDFGESFIKVQSFHQAVVYFGQIKDLSNLPNDLRETVAYYFAYGLYKIKRFDSALNAYDAFLDCKPQPSLAAMAYQTKGQIYTLLGDRWEDAKSAFFEALAIKGWPQWHRARAFYNLALSLNHMERIEEAAHFYSCALAIPDWQGVYRFETLVALATTLKYMKKPNNAIAYLEEAVKYPDISPAVLRRVYMDLARNSFEIENHEKAHEAFKQASLLDSTTMSAKDTLNWIRAVLSCAAAGKKTERLELYTLAENKLHGAMTSVGLTEKQLLQCQLDMATALIGQDKFKEVLPYIHKALPFISNPSPARGYALFLGIQSTYALQGKWGELENLRPKYAAYLKGDTDHLELLGAVYLQTESDRYE